MAKESPTAAAGAASGNIWEKDESIQKRSLTPVLLTAESFSRYGEVVMADNRPDFQDVRLNLSNGTPRFYLMNIQGRSMCVKELTRHCKTTQVLGSANGKAWYMAVAEPAADLSNPQEKPDLGTLQVFYIPGHEGIKLNEGTWHCGPLLEEEAEEQGQLFYNLELSDTNTADYHTVPLLDNFGVTFVFCEYLGEGSSKKKKD